MNDISSAENHDEIFDKASRVTTPPLSFLSIDYRSTRNITSRLNWTLSESSEVQVVVETAIRTNEVGLYLYLYLSNQCGERFHYQARAQNEPTRLRLPKSTKTHQIQHQFEHGSKANQRRILGGAKKDGW